MTYQQIEKAAGEYAAKTAEQYEVCNSEFVQEVAVAFERGAQYSLSHQWVSVEERLPELGERVLICEKVANQYKIFIGKRVSLYDGWEWNQSKKENVVAWMPLPKYNPEKEEK